jgi:hypothetical protein
MKRMNVTINDVGDLSFLFTGHNSPSKGFTLLQSEVADLTPLEAFKFLHSKLGLVLAPPKGIVETEIVDTGRSTQVEEIELDGDEDDEDVSLYEDVIETPYSYLSDRGII